MQTDHRHLPDLTRLEQDLDLFFASRGPGINTYAARRARMHEILRLYSLPEEDLTRMKLTRATIPNFVFRDLYPM